MSKVVRLFDARNRAKLALQNPSTPTGIFFEWGGIDFNIMPITFGELLETTALLDDGAAIILRMKQAQEAVSNGKDAMGFADLAQEALTYIVRDAPQIIHKLRDHLAKSPGVCDAGTEKENAADRAVFEAWFMEQDAKGMLLAFLPKLREVLANRPLGKSTANALEKPNSDEATATSST